MATPPIPTVLPKSKPTAGVQRGKAAADFFTDLQATMANLGPLAPAIDDPESFLGFGDPRTTVLPSLERRETPEVAAERRRQARAFAKGAGLGLTTDIAGLVGDLPALLLSDAPKFAAALATGKSMDEMPQTLIDEGLNALRNTLGSDALAGYLGISEEELNDPAVTSGRLLSSIIDPAVVYGVIRGAMGLAKARKATDTAEEGIAGLLPAPVQQEADGLAAIIPEEAAIADAAITETGQVIEDIRARAPQDLTVEDASSMLARLEVDDFSVVDELFGEGTNDALTQLSDAYTGRDLAQEVLSEVAPRVRGQGIETLRELGVDEFMLDNVTGEIIPPLRVAEANEFVMVRRDLEQEDLTPLHDAVGRADINTFLRLNNDVFRYDDGALPLSDIGFVGDPMGGGINLQRATYGSDTIPTLVERFREVQQEIDALGPDIDAMNAPEFNRLTGQRNLIENEIVGRRDGELERLTPGEANEYLAQAQREGRVAPRVVEDAEELDFTLPEGGIANLDEANPVFSSNGVTIGAEPSLYGMKVKHYSPTGTSLERLVGSGWYDRASNAQGEIASKDVLSALRGKPATGTEIKDSPFEIILELDPEKKYSAEELRRLMRTSLPQTRQRTFLESNKIDEIANGLRPDQEFSYITAQYATSDARNIREVAEDIGLTIFSNTINSIVTPGYGRIKTSGPTHGYYDQIPGYYGHARFAIVKDPRTGKKWLYVHELQSNEVGDMSSGSPYDVDRLRGKYKYAKSLEDRLDNYFNNNAGVDGAVRIPYTAEVHKKLKEYYSLLPEDVRRTDETKAQIKILEEESDREWVASRPRGVVQSVRDFKPERLSEIHATAEEIRRTSPDGSFLSQYEVFRHSDSDSVGYAFETLTVDAMDSLGLNSSVDAERGVVNILKSIEDEVQNLSGQNPSIYTSEIDTQSFANLAPAGKERLALLNLKAKDFSESLRFTAESISTSSFTDELDSFLENMPAEDLRFLENSYEAADFSNTTRQKVEEITDRFLNILSSNEETSRMLSAAEFNIKREYDFIKDTHMGGKDFGLVTEYAGTTLGTSPPPTVRESMLEVIRKAGSYAADTRRRKIDRKIDELKESILSPEDYAEKKKAFEENLKSTPEGKRLVQLAKVEKETAEEARFGGKTGFYAPPPYSNTSDFNQFAVRAMVKEAEELGLDGIVFPDYRFFADNRGTQFADGVLAHGAYKMPYGDAVDKALKSYGSANPEAGVELYNVPGETNPEKTIMIQAPIGDPESMKPLAHNVNNLPPQVEQNVTELAARRAERFTEHDAISAEISDLVDQRSELVEKREEMIQAGEDVTGLVLQLQEIDENLRAPTERLSQIKDEISNYSSEINSLVSTNTRKTQAPIRVIDFSKPANLDLAQRPIRRAAGGMVRSGIGAMAREVM